MTDAHPRFVNEMLECLWDEAEAYDIDPVGVVAQAYKETGKGFYPGKVQPGFYNTCGLKIRNQSMLPETSGDQPLAHQIFPNWRIGARAHVQHLCAYAGLEVPEWDLVDPRYPFVYGKHWVENFEELSGKWAPAADYGSTLVQIAKRLSARL